MIGNKFLKTKKGIIIAGVICFVVLFALIVFLYKLLFYVQMNFMEGNAGLILTFGFYLLIFILCIAFIVYSIIRFKQHKAVWSFFIFMSLIFLLFCTPLMVYPLLDLVFQETNVQEGRFKLSKSNYSNMHLVKYNHEFYNPASIKMDDSVFYPLVNTHDLNLDTEYLLSDNSGRKIKMEYYKYSGIVNNIEILK